MAHFIKTSKTACAAMALIWSLGALAPATVLAAPAASDSTGAQRPLPVWKIWTARTREDKTEVYEHFLVKVYKAKLSAWKAAGLIDDYRILTTEGRSSSDPDVIFMFKYANMAALDAPEELWDKVGDKAMEQFKDDKEVQQWMADFSSWRTFTGWWATPARELVAP